MPGSLKGNWSKAAIGGLVLLNLVLIVLLVLRDPPGGVTAVPAISDGSTSAQPTPSNSEPTASSIVPSPTPSARESPSATPNTPTPAPEPTASSAAPERAVRVLAVSSAEVAWRAVVGGCPTDPDLEVSRDGGHTWRQAHPELRSVSRLRAYGDSAVFAIGGGKGCRPRFVAAGGPGESWLADESQLEETWYRDPKQIEQVHAPGGRMSSPCGKRLFDFAGLGDHGAAALCIDGTVRATPNDGRSWRDLAGGSTGLALGADERSYALAMRHDRCDGIAVVLLDPDTRAVDRDAMRCAPFKLDADGELAIGVRGDVVWLWLGSEVMVSTNSGRTWKAAP